MPYFLKSYTNRNIEPLAPAESPYMVSKDGSNLSVFFGPILKRKNQITDPQLFTLGLKVEGQI